MGGVIFILMFLAPFAFIVLFTWLMKRWTGYYPTGQLGKPIFRRDDIDFLKKPDFYAPEPSNKRESKANPHYDALVDAEWQANRLEDTPLEDESAEIHSLSELLAKERRK